MGFAEETDTAMAERLKGLGIEYHSMDQVREQQPLGCCGSPCWLGCSTFSLDSGPVCDGPTCWAAAAWGVGLREKDSR